MRKLGMGRFLLLLLVFLAPFGDAYAQAAKPKTKHEIIEFLKQNPPPEQKLSIRKTKPYITKGTIDNNEKLAFFVRNIPDGPGVFNIFWAAQYNNTPEISQDLVGIIDPLFAAIRFFMIDSKKGAIKAIDEIGVCAIPIDFRPWQLYQKGDKIEIESMPMPKEMKSINRAKIADFTNSIYEIDREFLKQNLKAFSKALSKLNAAEDGSGAPWFPEENIQCGKLLSKTNKPSQTAPFKYQKFETNNSPQIEIKKNTDKTVIAKASNTASDLMFAYPIFDNDNGNLVWFAENQNNSDGIIKLKQRLVLYDNNNNPIWEKWFDETNIRYKLPLKPITALPNGNILAIGENKNPNGAKSYSIFSCGNPFAKAFNQQINEALCGNSGINDITELKPQKSDKKWEPRARSFGGINLNFMGLSEDKVFANMEPHLKVNWRVNTDFLPNECRKSKGCVTSVSKNAFVPLKSMRLTKGEYSHLGTPYAQADMSVANGFLKIVGSEKEAAENPEKQNERNFFTQSLSEVMIGGKKTPGNLNDYWAHDYGIDCSAFLQTAWGGGELSGRTNTAALQNGKFALGCQSRVANAEELKPGDAIGVRIDGGPNHVVIYGNNYTFDGVNQSWLVIESASSCDGVCISVYDPAFFNGWGLYRAKNRSDINCPDDNLKQNIVANPIPTNKASWAKKTKTEEIH